MGTRRRLSFDSRTLGVWLLAGLVLAWLAMLPRPLLAEAAPAQGVDAVLVIDSSGSMKETDPRRLRVAAAKMFTSLLSPDDRVGVISFSDDAYPVVHLLPATQANEARIFAGIDKVSARGVYTNLHAAVARGARMLGDEGRPGHRKLLVLLSDGHMDLGDADKDAELTRQVREALAPQLARDGVEVYAIAFTEASDMALMRDLARATGGMARMASNAKALQSAFSTLFESAKSPDMLPIEGGEFQVDQAVSEVTLVAAKSGGETIALERPDGKRLTAAAPGGTRWFQSSEFDMITIAHPAPGRWRLLSSGQDDRAYVVTNLGLVAGTDRPAAPVEKPVRITAWLAQDGARLTKPELLAQTEFGMEITQPDGTAVKLPLADQGIAGDEKAGDGVYTNRLRFIQVGPHRIRVVAHGPTFEREKVIFLDVQPKSPPAAAANDAKEPPDQAGKAETPPAAAEESPAPATETAAATPQETPPAPEDSTEQPPPVAEAPSPKPPEPAPAPEEKQPPAAKAPPAPAKAQGKTLRTGLVISLFVLINGLIALVVGTVLFLRKRKAAAAASSAGEDDDAAGQD